MACFLKGPVVKAMGWSDIKVFEEQSLQTLAYLLADGRAIGSIITEILNVYLWRISVLQACCLRTRI